MAHTFSTKLEAAGSTSNPLILTKNITSTVTLCVLSIITTGGARSGGAPTQEGTTMLSGAGSAGDGEQKVEIWYLLNDDISTGAGQQISIPNSGSDEISVVASFFIAGSGSSGFVSATVNGTIGVGTSSNPSTSVTGAAGGVIVDALGSGYHITPTANNRTLLYKGDTGSESYGTQYTLPVFSLPTTFNYTQPSDDWTHAIVIFRENEKPTIVYETADKINFGYDSTPTLEFTGSDEDGDDLTYHFRIDNNSNMSSPEIVVYSSGLTQGFLNTVIGGDLAPFTEAQKISYTVQAGDALSAGTYYWDCEATDLKGTKLWSTKPKLRSFTTSGATASGDILGWDTVSVAQIKVMNGVSESQIKTWNGVDW